MSGRESQNQAEEGESQQNEDNQQEQDAGVESPGKKKVNPLLKDLLTFQSSTCGSSLKVMMRMIGEATTYSIITSFTNIGSPLLSAAGFVLLNSTGDTLAQAALGISLSYNLLFYYGYILPLTDKLCIDMSLAYNARHFEHAKRIFNLGVYFSAMLFIFFTMPFFMFSKNILQFANIDANVALRCQDMLEMLLVSNVIETISDLLRIVALSQGYTNIFGHTSILAVVISIICAYLFVGVYGLGAMGWILSKYIYETIQLLVAVALFVSSDGRARGLLAWEQIRSEFPRFFFATMKEVFGAYSEFVGYEITSFFIFFTQNIHQIAAYTAILNFASLFSSLGESLAMILKSRMNLLISKGHKNTARNYFKFYICATALLGFILTAVIVLIRKYVAAIYVNSSLESESTLSNLILVYAFCMAGELTHLSSFLVVRIGGNMRYLIIVNISLFIFVNFLNSYYLAIIKGYGPVELFASLQVLFHIENLLCIIKVLSTDWEGIDLQVEIECDDVTVRSGSGINDSGDGKFKIKLTPIKSPQKTRKIRPPTPDLKKQQMSNMVLF